MISCSIFCQQMSYFLLLLSFSSLKPRSLSCIQKLFLEKFKGVLFIIFLLILLLRDDLNGLISCALLNSLLSSNVLFPQSKGRIGIKGVLVSFIALWFKDLHMMLIDYFVQLYKEIVFCYWNICDIMGIEKLLIYQYDFFFYAKHYSSWPIVFNFSWQSKQKIWRNCIPMYLKI